MTEFYSLSVIKELIKVHSTKKLAYLMAFRQGNEEYWDFKNRANAQSISWNKSWLVSNRRREHVEKWCPHYRYKRIKKPYSIEDRDKILEDIEKRYQEYKEMCDQLVLSYKERIIEMKEEIIFLREQLNK